MAYEPREIVYSRFYPYETLIVETSVGPIVLVRDARTGYLSARPAGELTRRDGLHA